MSRSADLDKIAPDDQIVETIKKKKVVSKSKKLKKTSVKKLDNSSSFSQFRQKVYELVGKTKHPLSAFLARPKVFTFDQRDTDEEIILVLRRHWFTNIGWMILTVLMCFGPLFLSIVPFLKSFPPNYKIIAILFWYLITFMMAFEKFLAWYFNVFIITEERVIDVDFDNLLNKEITEAKISMIQDVTYNVIGVAQTLFNFGTVIIQTASEIPMIEVAYIPNPNAVVKILQQMRLEEEEEALQGRMK